MRVVGRDRQRGVGGDRQRGVGGDIQRAVMFVKVKRKLTKYLHSTTYPQGEPVRLYPSLLAVQ